MEKQNIDFFVAKLSLDVQYGAKTLGRKGNPIPPWVRLVLRLSNETNQMLVRKVSINIGATKVFS